MTINYSRPAPHAVVSNRPRDLTIALAFVALSVLAIGALFALTPPSTPPPVAQSVDLRDRATGFHRDADGCVWIDFATSDGWTASALLLIDGRPQCDRARANNPPPPIPNNAPLTRAHPLEPGEL